MSAVPATVSMAEVNRFRWDVVVIGAGPAGALAARECARQGVSVLLIDKASFPRYKVCGCCINRRALDALGRVGLGQLVADAGGGSLHSFDVAVDGRRADLPLPEYRALSRAQFDAALVREAVLAGAQFLPETSAILAGVSADARSIQLKAGETATEVSARVALIASGLAGRLLANDDVAYAVDARSRVGAGALGVVAESDYAEGVIYMAVGKRGYVGLCRVEGGQADLGAALDASFVREVGGLSLAAAYIIDEAGLTVPDGIHELGWRGTPALTRTPSRLSAHRALVLGDAAGYVEPFTGEGIGWALASAVAVAPIACRGVQDFSSRTERAWVREHRDIVRRRQLFCRVVAATLRRPRATRAIVAAVSMFPSMGHVMLGHVNAVTKTQEESMP